MTAAGVVVFGPGKTVLLVHRPKYDDWSFPKGKLDRGEHAVAAAVRETMEETGVAVSLGPPLSDQCYAVNAGTKRVHYWTGRPLGRHDVTAYAANDEIDEVRWVPLDKAAGKLTYDRDRETLAEALAFRKRTRPLILQRHALARARGQWRKDDRLRPLLVPGHRQAQRLIPLLAAYNARRLVSSGSLRCVQTLEAYAAAAETAIEVDETFSEEDATPKGARRALLSLVSELFEAPRSAGALVICTHRPVLPWLFEALALDDIELEKGELAVVHLRRGKVLAVERHQPG
ncbi:NUDIX domain-containing protein [Nocardioides sp.]|uniref:NUDIX hydrolase n=1 Tax=Nocardioides sp. TaxID=35761 RepID=UPI003569F3EE